jgi:hypothetical protein
MLCQFAIGKFKSFKKESVLDLFAENIREHEKGLITDPYDGEAFLPVLSVYGPDKGGKYEVFEAFDFLSQRVLFPDNKVRSDSPVHLEVLFRVKEREYKYIFDYRQAVISEECLYMRDLVSKKPDILFERMGTEYYLGPGLGSFELQDLNPSLSLLSCLSKSDKSNILNDAAAWFQSIRYVRYDDTLSLSYENPFPILSDSLEKGGLLLPDDRGFQPDSNFFLRIIEMFKDPILNKKGAQLIFTSGDPTIMNSAVFRRDEIWFSAVNKNNESMLYPLVLFKLNKENSVYIDYGKEYTEGRYGADPDFKGFRSKEEDP